MASNGNPQSERYVFSQQANGAAGDAGRRFGRQDKARIASARTATCQPAPHTKPMRAHALNTGAARSQKKPNPKRKTVQLTLWIEPIVKRELQRIAQEEGLTVSKTGATFLKQALQHNVDMHYSQLLTPIIEAAIDRRMRARDNRFTSEQTRSLATNILGRQSGMTEETLKTILAMTKRAAQANLTRRNPEFAELLAAVKQWLADTEKEPATA